VFLATRALRGKAESRGFLGPNELDLPVNEEDGGTFFGTKALDLVLSAYVNELARDEEGRGFILVACAPAGTGKTAVLQALVSANLDILPDRALYVKCGRDFTTFLQTLGLSALDAKDAKSVLRLVSILCAAITGHEEGGAVREILQRAKEI
jgi:hypothetical protein